MIGYNEELLYMRGRKSIAFRPKECIIEKFFVPLQREIDVY